jgi:hypothetical protein
MSPLQDKFTRHFTIRSALRADAKIEKFGHLNTYHKISWDYPFKFFYSRKCNSVIFFISNNEKVYLQDTFSDFWRQSLLWQCYFQFAYVQYTWKKLSQMSCALCNCAFKIVFIEWVKKCTGTTYRGDETCILYPLTIGNTLFACDVLSVLYPLTIGNTLFACDVLSVLYH